MKVRHDRRPHVWESSLDGMLPNVLSCRMDVGDIPPHGRPQGEGLSEWESRMKCRTFDPFAEPLPNVENDQGSAP